MSALLLFTTIYGVIGALSGLFQLQRLYRTASAEDISLRFFLVYFGGYFVWLYYGIVQGDPALIIVDTVGIFVSGVTIFYALYLRITEGGQKLTNAIFDRSVTVRGAWSLSSNSAQEDMGPRPPSVLRREGIIYNPIYPLKRVGRKKVDPGAKKIAELGQGFTQEYFFTPVALWREIDGGKNAWPAWRESLLHSLSYLEEAGIEAAASSAARAELARKPTSRPSPERLSFCRTLFVLSLVVERRKRWPNDQALPAIEEQINHPRGFLASEQRWLEQLLATFYLPQEALAAPGYLKKLQEKLPEGILPSEEVFVAQGAWEDLLWPIQAGVNDFWGSPKALDHPIIKDSWLRDKSDLAILSSLLGSARQRNPLFRRYFFVHPLDYSINNGWQGLVIEEMYGQALPDYFPLETAFLKALGHTISLNRGDLIETVYNLNLGHTSLELARSSGISLDALIDIYQEQYKKIAKRCLPAKSDLDLRRLEENWLKILN